MSAAEAFLPSRWAYAAIGFGLFLLAGGVYLVYAGWKRRWTNAFLFAFIASTTGVVSLAVGVINVVGRARLERLQERLNGYLQACESPEDPGGRAEPGVVVVDARAQVIDPLQLDLPSELQARDPETVRTLVCLWCTDQVVARYVDGGRALMTTCEVALVDAARGRVVRRRTLTGPKDAPGRKTGHGDVYLGKPYDKVLELVRSETTSR